MLSNVAPPPYALRKLHCPADFFFPMMFRGVKSSLLASNSAIHVEKRFIFKVFRGSSTESQDKSSGVAVEGELEQEPFNQSSVWSHLTNDEVEKLRDKSRLPRDVWCEINGVPEYEGKFNHLELYKRDFVRGYYAKYGEASGLKPGVCWPTKQELAFRVEYEKTFYPPLEDLMKTNESKKKEKQDKLKEYRETILKNLKKLPQAKESFFQRYEEIEQSKLEEKKSRDKLIQDVREFLGYDVAPGDDRFNEAVTKMEEMAKVEKKGSKKQEKQAKMLALLSAMAEEELAKAQKQETQVTSKTEDANESAKS